MVSCSLMATQLRKRSGSFRPLSRYGWVPSLKKELDKSVDANKFPSPLEDWVGSYITTIGGALASVAGFPAPLEVWVVSYTKPFKNIDGYEPCFRPLARLGWGPIMEDTTQKEVRRMFPSPREGWVVSYFEMKK